MLEELIAESNGPPLVDPQRSLFYAHDYYVVDDDETFVFVIGPGGPEGRSLSVRMVGAGRKDLARHVARFAAVLEQRMVMRSL